MKSKLRCFTVICLKILKFDLVLLFSLHVFLSLTGQSVSGNSQDTCQLLLSSKDEVTLFLYMILISVNVSIMHLAESCLMLLLHIMGCLVTGCKL